MKLQFSALNEQGKRENNEDNYYPRPEDEKPVKDLYMVCDGVGGAEKGEVASNIARSSIAQYFKRNKTDEVNDSFVQSAIMQAESGMRKFIEDNPDSRGMATTLTLLYFDEQHAVVAHCGDSRVYQVRDGEILHKTFDHSLVNELLASGAIKDEEAARNHPKKNVITRALSGGKEHTEADVTFITDVKKDDFFLLCSDGILESLDDAAICALFVKENTAEFIRDEIKQLCDGHSNDNFTAIVVKTEQNIVAAKLPTAIVSTPEIVAIEQETPQAQAAEEEAAAEELIIIKETVQENYEKKSNKPIMYLTLLGVLAILVFAGYKYGLPMLKSDKKEKTEENKLDTVRKPEQKPVAEPLSPKNKANAVEQVEENQSATNRRGNDLNDQSKTPTSNAASIRTATQGTATKPQIRNMEKASTSVNRIEALEKELKAIDKQLEDTTLTKGKINELTTSKTRIEVEIEKLKQ